MALVLHQTITVFQDREYGHKNFHHNVLFGNEYGHCRIQDDI